jgi:hypothetical protein
MKPYFPRSASSAVFSSPEDSTLAFPGTATPQGLPRVVQGASRTSTLWRTRLTFPEARWVRAYSLPSSAAAHTGVATLPPSRRKVTKSRWLIPPSISTDDTIGVRRSASWSSSSNRRIRGEGRLSRSASHLPGSRRPCRGRADRRAGRVDPVFSTTAGATLHPERRQLFAACRQGPGPYQPTVPKCSQ